MTNEDRHIIQDYYYHLSTELREFVDKSIDTIIQAKERGGKVVVATGSGPNIHEGVTTLIAELMEKGIVDGVTTSSAVIAHEMGGVLDKVKRVDADQLSAYIDTSQMPRGNLFEFTQVSRVILDEICSEMELDDRLLEAGANIEGAVIIKAAGNMAYQVFTCIKCHSSYFRI